MRRQIDATREGRFQAIQVLGIGKNKKIRITAELRRAVVFAPLHRIEERAWSIDPGSSTPRVQAGVPEFHGFDKTLRRCEAVALDPFFSDDPRV